MCPTNKAVVNVFSAFEICTKIDGVLLIRMMIATT